MPRIELIYDIASPIGLQLHDLANASVCLKVPFVSATPSDELHRDIESAVWTTSYHELTPAAIFMKRNLLAKHHHLEKFTNYIHKHMPKLIIGYPIKPQTIAGSA